MAAFTSKAAGNWSSGSQTTWNQTGVPGSGDTVTITHAITIDVDTTIDGVTFSAGLTLAATKTFSIRGNVIQGDAIFTMGAGSILQATSGNVEWKFGTAVSQTNCKLVANGTIGSHCQIKKNGAATFIFEGDASFANCGGWEPTYVDFTGIHNADYTLAIGSYDYGLHHRRFLHCTFSDCGSWIVNHNNWGGSADKDYRVEYCKTDNVPRQTVQLYMRCAGGGAGTRTCLNNSFSDSVDIHLEPTDLIDYNYFRNGGSFDGGNFGPHNFMRQISRTHSTTFAMGLTNLYILADHVDPVDPILGLNDVGNPHLWNGYTQSTVNTGVVVEYPHEQNVDNGDGLYSTAADPDSPTIARCLSLASMTDDIGSVNLVVMATYTVDAIFQHNTICGRIGQGTAVERNLSGRRIFQKFESSLFVGFSGGSEVEWPTAVTPPPNKVFAAIDLLLPHPGYNNIDLIPASVIKCNDHYYPSPYHDPDTGLQHDGYALRMTGVPDSSNRNYYAGDPAFVDRTRCAATYAVAFLGAAALPVRPALPVDHGNAAWITWLTAKRAALDVLDATLMADPTIGTAVWTWVRAGFAPTAATLNPATAINQAVDGLTRGAIEYTTGGPPPPPPPSGVALVCARRATVYVP